MKQKFQIQKNDTEQQLIIRESAELDKDVMSLLCEVTFEADTIQNAIKAMAQLKPEQKLPHAKAQSRPEKAKNPLRLRIFARDK